MTKHGLSLLERIELHYIPEPNSGCWLWCSESKSNYPTITINNVARRANRVMYELHKGSIPKNYEVLHSCDIKCCVNPDHLSVGTHLQNMQEASQRKRFNSRRGSANNLARLTETQVLAIRADPRGSNTLAKIYDVDRTLIWQIRTRKVWTHI
jgi:Autographiviridae endonuclease